MIVNSINIWKSWVVLEWLDRGCDGVESIGGPAAGALSLQENPLLYAVLMEDVAAGQVGIAVLLQADGAQLPLLYLYLPDFNSILSIITISSCDLLRILSSSWTLSTAQVVKTPNTTQ